MTTQELDLPYASLGRRFLALLLDILILCVIGGIGVRLIPYVGGLIVWFFYAPVLESSELRATIGKHLVGIQVVDLAGHKASLRAAILRNAMKLVSQALLFLGFVIAFFSRKKQTLHDLCADTVIVYGRSELPIADTWIESIKELFRQKKLESPLSPSSSVISQLERLQALRNQGALSDEEFRAQKEKILSQT